MISVYLDPDLGANLRQTVNEDIDFSYKHSTEISKGNHKICPAWNRICALMDRIQDTAEHINNIRLHDEDEDRSAFSFLDLMNHASVLIDCIYEIARIYAIDMSQYETSDGIFHNQGNDNKGSDKLYFEYLRSLCSVHPINTDRHKRYQDGDYECCPYVYWGDELPGMDIYNICAMVYTDDNNTNKVITIYILEIKKYIENVYGLIETVIIPGIEAFKEKCREEFRKQPILPEGYFSDYKEYLINLKEEARKRYSNENDYYIDRTLLFFSVQFQEKKNRIGLLKIQNALKLAISYYHASLQNMCWEGYENTGIKYPTEMESTFLLDCLLHMRDTSKEAMKHGYAIGTFHELVDEDSTYYPYSQIETARPFLERYILLDEAKTRLETYVLTQIALYADALRNKNLINQNIPNDLRYRYRRLSEKSLEKLRKQPKERKTKANGKSLEYYMNLIKQYKPKSEEDEEI